MHRIIFKPAAQRQLAKLPKDVGERIARAIDALSDQPRPSVFGSVRPTSVRMACELAVGRTMRRDNSGLTQAMLQVDACMRRGGV